MPQGRGSGGAETGAGAIPRSRRLLRYPRKVRALVSCRAGWAQGSACPLVTPGHGPSRAPGAPLCSQPAATQKVIFMQHGFKNSLETFASLISLSFGRGDELT